MSANESQFVVRYERTAATFTSQFVLSASDEELLLDCSSGLISDEGGKELLPIHTRLAMPWTAARRLGELLNRVIRQHDERTTASEIVDASTTPDRETCRTARLPKFENTNV